MLDLNFPADYVDRLLGYDLFTSNVKALSNKLNMDFSHPVELAVLYDIVAKCYLNALDDHIYTVNLLPLFYLQLEDVQPHMCFIAENKFDFYIPISSGYVEHKYAEKIKMTEEYLEYLKMFILYYRQECFEHNTEQLVGFIKSFLLRHKPKLLDSINDITSNSVIEKVNTLAYATPELGERLVILRPYYIKVNKTWNVEKVSVFNAKRSKRLETCHFDIFSTVVIDKRVTKDNQIVITLETSDKEWQFITYVKPTDSKRKLIIQWYMCVGGGEPKSREMEPVPFYTLKDIPAVNAIKGRKLNKFQLDCLFTDAKVQLLANM